MHGKSYFTINVMYFVSFWYINKVYRLILNRQFTDNAHTTRKAMGRGLTNSVLGGV